MVDGYMNKRALLGGLPLVFLLPVHAETLESITVHGDLGSKRDRLEDSFYKSYSLEVLTKEEMEEESAIDIKSALQSLPGVKVKESGSFSKDLEIRGLGGDRVISVVDGVKLVNQGMTHSGGGELGLIDPSTVETIELVKGSPSVIYDPGATGGVISISTLKDIKAMEDKVKVKYNYQYDDGYWLNKNTLFLEGKYKDFYSSLNYSITDSKGRNVKDTEKLQKTLDRTNAKDERYGTDFMLSDLGYESKSYSYVGGYQVNDRLSVYLRKSNYTAEDISFTHGSSTSTVFHYDEYERDALSGGFKFEDVLGMDKIDLTYSDQEIIKVIQTNVLNKDTQTVESDTFKIDASKRIDAFELLVGAEYAKDEAKTYTFSNQEYLATYLNGTYDLEHLLFNAGVRYNHYRVEQEIEPGRNLDTIHDLVGVSGVLEEPLTDDAFTYALGVTYLMTESQNLAFNYSRTYRYPSLYERFAFDNFIGGGADMEAEEADSFELSWKYLDDTFFSSLTFFYTKFDTYNDVYEYRKIKDVSFLRECNEDPDCDPFDDDVNENKIFSTFLKYATFHDVVNRGFEFTMLKQFEAQEIELGFNTSLSDLSDGELDLANAVEPMMITFDQDPLEFSAHIKKDFVSSYEPWVRLRVRHVTNSPEVKQQDGFDPFTVANLYFGFRYKDFVFNGGIRNLSDEVYNEPYMGLDGVKRTFFMNASISFEKLL